MRSTRPGALALVTALVSGVMAVVIPAGTASATWSPPTLDGPTYDWITPGPGYTVTGTVPGGAGMTVTGLLASQDTTVVGSATVAMDDTFVLTVDTSTVTTGDTLYVRVPRTAPGDSGTMDLRRDLWVNQGAPMLTLDVPGGGAPVTDLGPGACLQVTGHLADPTLQWNFSASQAYAGDGTRVTPVSIWPGSNGADPSTLTGCIPLGMAANGTDDVWIHLVSDTGTYAGNSYNTRVQIPLALTTVAGPATTYSNGSYAVLVLPVTDPGPDANLALTFDGMREPAVGTLPQPGAGLSVNGSYVYEFLDNRALFDWSTIPRTRLVADGVHQFHAVLTSRGVVTDLGDIPVTVDTKVHLTIDAVTPGNGTLTVAGHVDNVPDTYPDPNQTAVVTHPGMAPITVTQRVVSPQDTGAYGTNTYTQTVSVIVPPDGLPTTLTVSGHDLDGNVATVSRDVSAIVSIGLPTVPSAPFGVTAAPGKGSAAVSWSAPVSNGGSMISGYTVTASPGGASCSPVLPALSCTVSGLSDGTPYTFMVTARNNVGTSTASAPSAAVTPDGVAPTVVVNPLPIATAATSVRVSWKGSDAGSGVASYDVRLSRAAYNTGFAAPVYPAAGQHLTATSAVLSLAAGSTYCVQVRDRDRAGNVSPWSPVRCVARALDDRAFAAGRGWVRGVGSPFYLRTVTATRALGAVLVRTGARLDRVGIVATRCPGCGVVGIYVGGRLIGKLSLYLPVTRYRQLLVLSRFSYRSGTVVVRSLSTRKVVQVDGLVVTRV